MDKICYICHSKMEKKNIPINTGWGEQKITVEGIISYVCHNCGEKVLSGKDAMVLQRLSRRIG